MASVSGGGGAAAQSTISERGSGAGAARCSTVSWNRSSARRTRIAGGVGPGMQIGRSHAVRIRLQPAQRAVESLPPWSHGRDSTSAPVSLMSPRAKCGQSALRKQFHSSSQRSLIGNRAQHAGPAPATGRCWSGALMSVISTSPPRARLAVAQPGWNRIGALARSVRSPFCDRQHRRSASREIDLAIDNAKASRIDSNLSQLGTA